MTWMLIDASVAARVRLALIDDQNRQEDHCGSSGCMCDLYYSDKPHLQCGRWMAALIHEFDTGMHTTDAIPADFDEKGVTG